MTAAQDSRAQFEANINALPNYFEGRLARTAHDDGYKVLDVHNQWIGWQASRAALSAEPVQGDCLPPIGSRVFIRHGRDEDAHPCIVTGYYAWGDLNGSKRLHRVFVRLVYEGTDTKQARMLCDCYATAEDALAAAPQPAAHKGE